MTHLAGINWKVSWGGDLSLIKRVPDVSLLTIGVILDLCTQFQFKRGWEIIKLLLPDDFSLNISFACFTNKVQRLKKKRPRKAEELRKYYKTPFFSLWRETPVEPDKSTQSQQICESCLELQAKLSILRHENDTVKQENDKVKQENDKVEQENDKVKQENSDLREKLDKTQTESAKRLKQYAGKCSALARVRTAATAKSFVDSHSVVHEKQQSNFPIEKDLYHFVKVTRRNEDSRIFEGIEYLVNSEKKNASTPSTFVRVNSQKPNSEIGARQMLYRAQFLWTIMELVSGSTNKEEIILLLSRWIKSFSELFLESASRVGFLLRNKLTVTQAVDLQANLRLSYNTVRNLRTFFSNIGFNIFPSEGLMRKEQTRLISHVDRSTLSVNFESLVSCENEVKAVSVLRVPDLIEFVRRIVAKLLSKNQLDIGGDFNNKIWLNFGGDKGGTLMKFHFEVVNSHQSGSVYNLHLFAMYEASDCYINMAAVLFPFVSAIKEMQKESFCIEGHKVLLFLSGDFKFLDSVMGHQGSSASYPNLKDLVTLSHLQNHGGNPHSPAYCKIPERVVTDFEVSYNENLAENGGQDRDLSKTGKHHKSVTRRCIFPVATLNQIVPPVLHITLGIVLKLFKILQDTAKNYDSDVSRTTRIGDQEKEWIKTSSKLLAYQNLMKKSGCIFINFSNFKDRFSAISEGNLAKLDEIAQGSDTERKSPQEKEVHKCEGLMCCITQYDSNINWVECNSCSKWLHYLCEGISEFDNEDILASDFVCSCCAGETSMVAVMECKIQALREHQLQLETECRILSLRCDELQGKVEEDMGPREQMLLKALDEIKVVRQAYHGNVFVGNHCKVILKKYKTLLSCISDKQSEYDHLDELFGLYADIHPLISSKRFLTEPEISSVSEKCVRFTEIFPVFFPNINITRKMHELAFDVPRFLAKHKTLGLLSEEEGESLHSSVNQELRQLSCVRDSQLKLKLIMRRQEIRGLSNRSLLAKKPRKCTNCLTFFKEGLCECLKE